MTENKFGKKSRLELAFSEKKGETRLEDARYTAPLKIMCPFKGADGELEVMVLSASAGLMEGDHQEFRIQAGSGTRALVTSQAYEKIHKMESGEARRETFIRVEEQAALEYRPLPTIPFAQSAFRSTTQVRLQAPSSRFCYSEVLSCGRKARGEMYRYRYYYSRLEVYQQEKLVFLDNSRYVPAQQDMQGVGQMEGYSHQGFALLYGVADPEIIQNIMDEQPEREAGITRLEAGGILIRIFGNRAQLIEEQLQTFINKIWKKEPAAGEV